METTNFSIRTKVNTLSMFDSILKRQNLSRNGVIERFMLYYIKMYSEQNQTGLSLTGNLAKYKGIASKLDKETVFNDPRAKHAMGYGK